MKHAMSHTTSKKCKFETVLVARCEISLPSELEIILSATNMNQWCRKVRIVSSLCAGAHFVFSSPSQPTVALRVYDGKDVVSVEKKQQLSFDSTDVDQLQQFRDSFENPLTFFILPPGELQRRQLTDPCSFFQTAQRVLSKPTDTFSQTIQEQRNYKSEDVLNVGGAKNQARIFIVTDALSILQNVSTFIDSISNEKCLLKKQFFEGQATKATQEQGVAIANALRTWSSHYNIPIGDVNVLMSFLGSLENIMLATSAVASPHSNFNAADTSYVLNTIPIQDSSKRALITLFYGEQEINQNRQHSNAEVHEQSSIATGRQRASFFGNSSAVDTFANELDRVSENHSHYANNIFTRDLKTKTGEVVGVNNCSAQKQRQLQQQQQHQQHLLLQPRHLNGVTFTPAMAENRRFGNIGHSSADVRMQQIDLNGNSRPPLLPFNHNRNNNINMPPFHQQQQYRHPMKNLKNLSPRVQHGPASMRGNTITMSNNRKCLFAKGNVYSVPNTNNGAKENPYPYLRSPYHGQLNTAFHPTNSRNSSYL